MHPDLQEELGDKTSEALRAVAYDRAEETASGNGELYSRPSEEDPLLSTASKREDDPKKTIVTSIIPKVEIGKQPYEELEVEYERRLRALVTLPWEPTPSKEEENNLERLLARYTELYASLSATRSVDLYRSALIGIAALEAHRTTVAWKIAEQVEFSTSTSAALGQVMRGLVRFLLYSTLVIFLIGYSGFSIVFLSDDVTTLKQLNEATPILLAALFGCLGSVVSLLLRLSEFEVLRGRSRQFLYLTGLTLPLVGGVFAAVIASLFASQVINLSVQQQAGTGTSALNLNLFIVIGFLSGFSERFTRGLLTTAENTFGGNRESQATNPPPEVIQVQREVKDTA